MFFNVLKNKTEQKGKAINSFAFSKILCNIKLLYNYCTINSAWLNYLLSDATVLLS